MMTSPAADTAFQLVVHIGDGKTGSSAIQRLLRTEAGTLAGGGFAYLGLMLEYAPLRKYEWQRDTRIEAFHALPKERAAAELAEVLEGSIADARERGLRGLVMSNETLLGRSPAAIEALLRVRGGGVDVRPIVYLRRHDAWARSGYAQWGLRHKTYGGPIKNFVEWCETRRLAVYPKLEPWLEAFGSSVAVRNFDAIPDVSSDFLTLLGIDPGGATKVRANVTPSLEELALRALFNHQAPGATPPVRFNKLLGSGDVDFRLKLDSWLKEKLPTPSQLSDVAETYAADRALLDAALQACGQPPLATAPLNHSEPVLDHGALLSALFQLLVRQAQRVEALEQKVAKMGGLSAPVPGQKVSPSPVVEAGSDEVDWCARAPGEQAEVLAPALGYFGANPTDRLIVDVSGKVRELRLSVSEPVNTFLNLGKLELIQSGQVLTLPEGNYAASQSSAAEGTTERAARNLIAGSGIHTTGEKDPWWQVKFDPPIAIDQLRITNRSDGWGSRSRTLRVDSIFEDGSTGCLYYGQAEAKLTRALQAASSVGGIALPIPLPTSMDALASLRTQLLGSIADRLRMKQCGIGEIPWLDVVALLDVWGRGGEPSRDEWTVIAAFLLSQQQSKAGTSIKSFSLMLNTHERLRRLQQELNDLGHALGLGGFMLTRHGVKQEGVLRREPERFLSHMMDVLEALMRMGRDPVLAYGTLLGAVRDRDFIAHDDDIDLLYRSDCTSRAAVETELLDIKEALRAEGFKVADLLPNSLNMHVISRENGAVMDIFPCWREDGALQMHMEGMKVRGIDPSIVYPTQSIEFLGEHVPAPAKPDEYLQERYGSGWRQPDQFFEWPWQLKQPGQ